MQRTAPARLSLWFALGAASLTALAWTLYAGVLPALPDVAWLHARQHDLLAWQGAAPWLFGIGFFVLFTLLAAIALPGCSVLCLCAGLCFGMVGGTLLVATASAAGATLSFLASRHLLRDKVRRRWGHRLAVVDRGLERDGAAYLFALRVAPVIPYPVLNPLMGLSSMSLPRFFIVSLFGMLAGSAAYVYMGTELGHVTAWPDLLAPDLLLVLTLLALLPWATGQWWRRRVRVSA